ncbi:MAG: hypothetical protein ACK5MT_08930 [Actinomycetales bacterium]
MIHRVLRSIPGLVLIVGLFVGTAGPAAADPLECYKEATYITTPVCPDDAIVNSWAVGDGGLLDKQDLLKNLTVYQHYGFTQDWIEHSVEAVIPVDVNTSWSGCASGGQQEGLCPLGQVFPNPVGLRFNQNQGTVSLHVYTDGTNWIARMCGNFVMLAPPADVEKVALSLVDAPDTIDADTDVTVTVRSRLRNNGPLDIALSTDTLTIDPVNPDCTVRDPEKTKNVSLPVGQIVNWTTTFTIRCTEPSNHTVKIRNTLVGPRGHLDADLANNTRTLTWTPAVLDRSDVRVLGTTLTCPAQTMVRDEVTCQGTARITNAGPHGPEPVTSTLDLATPSDCTIRAHTGDGQARHDRLDAGQTQTRTASWTLACSDRSFHDLALTAQAALAHDADEHVLDPDPSNNTGRAATTMEVFEEVDLETSVLDLQCSEREHNQLASTCTASVEITNNGLADHVITDTAALFTVEDTCMADPAEQTQEHVLAAGSSEVITFSTQITCTSDRRHVVGVEATLANSPKDPHAVDSDSAALLWVPSDIKPRSLPSAINVNRNGLVPFAILGTADFDPLTQVTVDSLTFGAAGVEDSVVRCAPSGEDVNDDGYLDLVCHADAPKTGISCESEVLITRGLLKDGAAFISQDAVKTTGCRR